MSWKISLFVIIFVILGGWLFYSSLFGAVDKNAKPEQFTVPLGQSSTKTIQVLKHQGFIKSELGFRIAVLGTIIKPGAYKISKALNVWEMADIFKRGPYMKWVVIPEGYRKEQIAEIIGRELNWSEELIKQWIEKDTVLKKDEIEGVYFPETYLIPIDETPAKVAERMRAKFSEVFAPYAAEAIRQNIKWTTLLKIASLVQREAGNNDMPLIAGILWNRLLKGMKLEIDATLQYLKGSSDNWWPAIRPEDKKINSLYNTYLHKGLPPTPIANPGLNAIKAALFPQKTPCFYYIHDKRRDIHCAKTYAEHLTNIETYLKEK